MVATQSAPPNVVGQRRRKQLSFLFGYGLFLFMVVFVYLLSQIFGPVHAASFTVLVALLILAVVRPAIALGGVIAMTIVGDPRAMPWWPVDKNLSSGESLLFTSDALTVKPLEITLAAVLAVLLVNQLIGRARRRRTEQPDQTAVETGTLMAPITLAVIALGAATVFGIVRGLSRGSELNVTLLEAGAMLYVPAIFFTAKMLFTTIDHYRRLLIAIVGAIFIESVHTLATLTELRERYVEGNSPLAHTAALQMNMVFLALIATLVLRRRALPTVVPLLIVAIPTMLIYLEAERRSAIVALVIGTVLVGVALFHADRLRFKIVAPILLIGFVLYLGAFWNVDTGIGFPAQTIRNIIAPGSRSAADTNSDVYRQIENFNLLATIRSNPILGLGYGQEFLQPIPLPRITNFIFATIAPHNATLGLWFKTGLLGIASYVFLIASGTAAGVRSVLQAVDPRDRVVLLVFVANVPMTFVVTFVEIAFDPPTTTVLGLSLALAASSRQLVARRTEGSSGESGEGPPAAELETGEQRTSNPDRKVAVRV